VVEVFVDQPLGQLAVAALQGFQNPQVLAVRGEGLLRGLTTGCGSA
jgi:hypothetical protein